MFEITLIQSTMLATKKVIPKTTQPFKKILMRVENTSGHPRMTGPNLPTANLSKI
jgi:hypothetical protein